MPTTEASQPARSKVEADLEAHLVEKLVGLKYTHRPDITDRDSLHANFRQHFEALNKVTLTDGEFERLLTDIITADVFESAVKLREINSFVRDDGTPLNYQLVNLKDWCKNTYEVVSQLRINTGNSHHRYDVILLINGIPAAQIELKSLGISPRKAMQQIVDYKSDPGNGYTNTLLSFVQLFIVSNRDRTYYFTNNNKKHFQFNAEEQFLPVYEFADEDNRKITHLDDFAEAFLAKCTLGRMISRCTVLVAGERQLMMMRPYQIYAVRQIVDCIKENTGNGYIWHTTGSGKTLTSFKASTLLKYNEHLHKVLFVVDRKDLDVQTRKEFNRFQDGCVEDNSGNTAGLVRRLLSDNYADKVIVTTIQKLGLALDQESKRNRGRTERGKETYRSQLEPLRDKRLAIIFDECHRSQFGQTHQTIKEFFPNAQFFGFTGTPIFEENATAKQIDGDVKTLKTTDDLFQQRLHAYTITNAIDDRNVLRFHVDYYELGGEDARQADPHSVKKSIVEAILAKHDAATGGRRFNAVFATSSINDAIEYYGMFDALQNGLKIKDPDYVPLNVTAVFSPPAEGNPDVKQLQEDLPQEQLDNRQDPEHKKKALTEIINHYNERYGTNHSINEFDSYYQDVQQRIKSQAISELELPESERGKKIDITIVVDMLLTGFDSKYLNTLYVDKNLKHHGLIQAFSRTNRVLNDTKPSGHILDFRGQKKEVDEAIRLFSGVSKSEEGDEVARKIWIVEPAIEVIEKLKTAKADLDAFLASQDLPPVPSSVANLKGDDARAAFVQQFKEVQRLATQLDQYTDLTEEQREEIEATVPSDEHRGFRGQYLELAKQLRELSATPGETSPVIDQLDLELVLFASATIDYDYIMKLIAELSQQDATGGRRGGKPSKSEMTREQLIGLIQSDAKFLDEREEIAEFVRTLETGRALNQREVSEAYAQFKAAKQARQLEELATKHGLEPTALEAFVTKVLDRMIFDGESLTDLLAPLELPWKERRDRELALMQGLIPLLKARADGRKINGLDAWEQ